MTINLSTQRETQTNLRMERLWKPRVVSNGFTVEKLRHGKWSNTEMLMMSPYHLLHHNSERQKVGERVLAEAEKKELAEEAIIIWFITEMSHRFTHSPLKTNRPTVRAHQIAAITPDGVAYQDYRRYHQQVTPYTVVLLEGAVLAESTKAKRAKWSSQMCSKKIHQMTPSHIESGSTQLKATSSGTAQTSKMILTRSLRLEVWWMERLERGTMQELSIWTITSRWKNRTLLSVQWEKGSSINKKKEKR